MKPKLFFDANNTIVDFSRSLRKEMTGAEKLLWANLKN
ncbi:MAG: hypothetical protein JWN78_707, partial [Bacteroidota bacterium]|nr:hypothetical protein [Bacteroidota bacterium]